MCVRELHSFHTWNLQLLLYYYITNIFGIPIVDFSFAHIPAPLHNLLLKNVKNALLCREKIYFEPGTKKGLRTQVYSLKLVTLHSNVLRECWFFLLRKKPVLPPPILSRARGNADGDLVCSRHLNAFSQLPSKGARAARGCGRRAALLHSVNRRPARAAHLDERVPGVCCCLRS